MSIVPQKEQKIQKNLSEWAFKYRSLGYSVIPLIENKPAIKWDKYQEEFIKEAVSLSKALISIIPQSEEKSQNMTDKPQEKKAEISQDFLKIPHNDGTWQIFFNLPLIVFKGKQDPYTNTWTLKFRNGKIEFVAVKEEENGRRRELLADEYKELLEKSKRNTIQALFNFLLWKAYQKQSRTFTFTLNEYFNIRELQRKHNRIKQLEEDLKILQFTRFDFCYQLKKKTIQGVGYGLVFDIYWTEGRGKVAQVEVTLGKWAEPIIKGNQFTLLPASNLAYNFNNRNNWIYPISNKLAEIIRNNQKNGEGIAYKVTVETLLKILPPIHKYQNRHFAKLKNALETIAKQEGYKFTLSSQEPRNFEEFKAIEITFYHPGLRQAYKELQATIQKRRTQKKQGLQEK